MVHRINDMPYKHVSSIYVRTLLIAYDMLLGVMQSSSSMDDVYAWIKAYIGFCDNAIDVFFFIDDTDMVHYMLSLSIHMAIFKNGMSRDIENIRFYYSIGF